MKSQTQVLTLIPTSLEIGTKPLDLEGLGRKRLSGSITSLRTDKVPTFLPRSTGHSIASSSHRFAVEQGIGGRHNLS